MKYAIIIISVMFMAFTPAYMAKPIKEDCTCKGIKLWGKVKIVENFENFKVKIVENFEDIRIDTNNYPYKCGQWQFVNYHEDFSVKFVDYHEDFSIKFDKHFYGL